MNSIKFICYSTYIFAFCTSILPNDPLTKNSSYDEPMIHQESQSANVVEFQEAMQDQKEDFLCEKPLYERENLELNDLDSYDENVKGDEP